MSEEEVFTEVANLFRGQEDLLSEFGQFLPEAKRSLVSAKCPGSCLQDVYAELESAEPGLHTVTTVLWEYGCLSTDTEKPV